MDDANTLVLGKCWGCGKPIPELLVENGKFNFRCQKCGAETRFQDTIYEAVDIWNEGRTYSFDEAAFMAVVTGKVSCYKDALSLKNPLTASDAIKNFQEAARMVSEGIEEPEKLLGLAIGPTQSL